MAVLFMDKPLVDTLYSNIMKNKLDDYTLSPEVMKKIFMNVVSIRSELLEILLRRDVRPFGEDEKVLHLDRKLHKAIRVEPAKTEDENNKISSVTKRGYFWGEKVLRPQEVVIKKYEKPSIQ